jgi:2-amino-4-hydroxy-6-hydroxymethyldihydropteridine diphosphokinase
MDEPELQINKAVDLIAAEEDITLLRKSSLAITKAYGYERQDDFFNQVLEIESQLAPELYCCVCRALKSKEAGSGASNGVRAV